MPPSLPVDPSGVFLRKGAEKLVRAHRSGDAESCETYRLLRRFSGLPDQEILGSAVSLQETQLALARQAVKDYERRLILNALEESEGGRESEDDPEASWASIAPPYGSGGQGGNTPLTAAATVSAPTEPGKKVKRPPKARYCSITSCLRRAR